MYGYRSENAYGSGVRDIIDILYFESTELNNDTFAYLLDEYPEFEEYEEKYYIMSHDEQKRDVIREMISALEEKVGDEISYGLWLCDSPQMVADYYNAEKGP